MTDDFRPALCVWRTSFCEDLNGGARAWAEYRSEADILINVYAFD